MGDVGFSNKHALAGILLEVDQNLSFRFIVENLIDQKSQLCDTLNVVLEAFLHPISVFLLFDS